MIADLNLASQLEYDMQPLALDLEINTEYQYMISGDRELIKRAVDNLLNNSINHNPDGCNISIMLNQNKQHISITISDDGVGVSQDKLNHIIKVPHYLNSKEITMGLQHGMGLHLVKKIILSHGGEILISSEKGKGFRVQILLKT